MAELDLDLVDALTDAPQMGPESRVERDFVAQLEAEAFDDKVGETVGKTDYIPLLDNDDPRADTGTSALENGEQEAHGAQKPGCKLSTGGQTSLSHPQPQGEVRPLSLDQNQALGIDFLSGFSQPSEMGFSVETGAAPLQAERPPSIAEPQQSTPAAGSEAPKEHSPMLPEPQVPRSPADVSSEQGALGDRWLDQAGCLPTDLPFTPSVSTVISRHAGHLAASPDDPPDSWPGRESVAYAGGDERDADGSDRKQKKKKKRRQKDEGSYEHPENRGHPEMQAQGENTPPADEFYHRIGPRRDTVEGAWEEQLGKSGGRGKKGKSRKKLPEEWAVMAQPFVPSSEATSQITEKVMIDLGSAAHANLESSFPDMDSSLSPWKQEVFSEGLVPAPLSEDLFSSTAAPISPLVLNSELKATAPPFTMPSPTNTVSLDSAPQPHDPFDLLMDTEHVSMQIFSTPVSSENQSKVGDTVDSKTSDRTSSLQESYVQRMSEEDTSIFSPASQPTPDPSPQGEVLASAPPLSPSDASWLLNDSNIGSNSEMFDFSEMSSSGQPLVLGLSFNTPSPAPLRSPKTTAQEFQAKQHKDDKSSQKQSKKSRSSSSSSPAKSPTSSGAENFPPQESPVVSPSSPPPLNPLGAPGSALNPAAKPFFPSFADTMEEPAVVAALAPTIEGKSDKMEESEKKVETLGDDVKKVDQFEPLDKAEQKSVKVEFSASDTPVKVEKEEEKKRAEKERDLKMEKEAQQFKETEKVEEMKKEPEKVEEIKKMDEMKKEPEKVDEMKKVEEMKKEPERVEEIKKEPEKVEEIKKEPEKLEEIKKEPEKVVEIKKEPEKLEEIKKEPEKVVEMKKEPEKLEETLEKMEMVQQKVEKEDQMKKGEESPEKAVKTDKVEMTEMMESKPKKAENMVTMDTNEKTENTPTEKLEKADMKDVREHTDKAEEKPEQQQTTVTFDTSEHKEEKKNDVDTKVTAVEEKTDADKVKKTEEDVSEKVAEKPTVESVKQEKQDQTQVEKKTVDKKDEKKDKTAKAEGDKVKKAKAAANGSKDLTGADKKTKSFVTATKPSTAAKMRPSSTAASSGSGSASARRLTPSSTSSTSDKKTTTVKTTATNTAGPKRPSNLSTSRLSTSTTSTTRDVKAKTTTEKRPSVPKVTTTFTSTSNQTGSTAATKNGTGPTAASKTTTSTTSARTSASARTAAAAAAKKPLLSKTNSKAAEEKKPSTLKTSAADSTKPKTSTSSRTTGASSTTTTTTTTTSSRTLTKPAAPSSTSGSVPEKKPLVPRVPRAASSTTMKSTARPGTAPAPDIRNVRSKIGSTDNMKHQAGGGKVSSASQNRAVAPKEMSQSKVQIQNKKVDLSKVTSKCGSKDNIKHKPGGGDIKIESRKLKFKEKAQSKVTSMENVNHSPGGGNIKAEAEAEGAQETAEGTGTPLSGTEAPASEPGQAGGPAAQENGLKDGAPCVSEGLREPQALDSSIPETN